MSKTESPTRETHTHPHMRVYTYMPSDIQLREWCVCVSVGIVYNETDDMYKEHQHQYHQQQHALTEKTTLSGEMENKYYIFAFSESTETFVCGCVY